MKILYILIGIIAVLIAGFYAFNSYIYNEKQADPAEVVPEVPEQEMVADSKPVTVVPISHATMVLNVGEVHVYVDPVGGAEAFAGQPVANIVLVTDIHGDHLSTSTLEAVVGDETVLIVPQAVKDLLPEALALKAQVLKNDEAVTEQGLAITAIAMYNVPETDDSRHVKGRGNGYVIDADDTRVYIAGDTGPTPEMKALTSIDMAFVPMNLPYTMSVEEAAQAVVSFAPAKVYPYHYRQPEGFADVEKFKSLVNIANPNIEVVLLPWYTQ